MSTLTLHSDLAPQIQRFIDLRRLSGTDYHSQAKLLEYFDRFLAAQPLREPRITRRITEAYQQSLIGLAPRTQYNRLCVLRRIFPQRSDSEML